MRVLHLFDWYLPSTLSWVSRLLLHLGEAEIWVGAPWIVENQFFHPLLKHFEFPLQISGLLQPKSEWDYSSWQLLLTRSQRFIPTYSRWLHFQIRNNPPEILHAHFGPTGCLYLPLAQKLNRPLVVTFYGFDYERILHRRPVFRSKYQNLFTHVARVIAASPTGCRALEALGCPAEKLRIVRPSPDLDHFPRPSLKQKPPGQLNLVQVATFTGKKGHLTTLKAFANALKSCPNLHLTLAGEKQNLGLVKRLEYFIRTHELQPYISWLDPIDHRDMASFLTKFDAFIHPSCRTDDGDHEASPVVLLEAQACGLPVLTTRHFDLADTVAQGVSGLLVAENDLAGLAEAIRKFYFMNADDFEKYQSQARDQVEQNFTVKTSATALQNIYHELL